MLFIGQLWLISNIVINFAVNDSKLVFIGVTTSAIIVMVIVLSLILIIRKCESNLLFVFVDLLTSRNSAGRLLGY